MHDTEDIVLDLSLAAAVASVVAPVSAALPFVAVVINFVDVVEIFKTRPTYSPIDFSQLVYCYNFVSVFAPLVSARARKLPFGIKLSLLIRPLIDRSNI